MTIKRRLLYSVGWLVLIVVIGVVGIFWIHSHSRNDAEMMRRASMFGSGLGIATSIGIAALWLPFAAQVGKRKREERERAKTGKSGKPKRRTTSGRPSSKKNTGSSARRRPK